MSPTAALSTSRRIGLLCLALAVLGWGLNWPGIKLLLREWPPLFARGTAGLLGAMLLAAYARASGESLAVSRAALPRLAWASFTNVFAWMGFSTVALKWLDVAEAALLVYSMPIWATLLAWPVLGTRPTPRTVLALVLSFSGVVLILTGGGVSLGAGKLPGVALVLTASILFALGTVTSRNPPPLSPAAMTAWQVGLGCLPMVVLGLVFERDRIVGLSALGWSMWTFMAVMPMGLSYLGWFAVLRHLPPATAASGTLLVPIIGVLAAAPVLGEPFGLRQIVAMALSLGGVALALRRPRG